MFKVEEYIAKRKKEDKIDEFDFKKHSEEMASIIKYVTDYFNNYLNLEDYDYEMAKTQQTVNKILILISSLTYLFVLFYSFIPHVLPLNSDTSKFLLSNLIYFRLIFFI